MQERRYMSRWRMQHKAKLKQEGAQRSVNCHIIDANLRGLQVVLPIKLERDTFLKMQLVLSEDHAIEVQVWAVWYKAVDQLNLYGLYFTEIKEADKERLYRFIRSYSPQEIDKRLAQKLGKEKGGKTMEDHRIFARFPVSFPVKFLELLGFTEGLGTTRDISAKGVGLVAKQALGAGADVELWINVPDKGEPLYTRGKVAWSQPAGVDEYRIGINLEKADLIGLSRILRVS